MAFNMPRHMLIFLFLRIILIFSETRFSVGPTQTVALTDAQRKEIATIRAELDAALEKDEEKNFKQQGLIVQPKWTQHITGSARTIDPKVVVTNKELRETKALRDEITMAVKQDAYTPMVGRGNIGGNTRMVQELHRLYVNNENNKKAKDIGLVGSEQTPTTGPNVIDFNMEPEMDIKKLQSLQLSKRRGREMLVLESIVEDYSFNLGEHVQEWEHIWHGGQEYFIGRLEQELQIVHKHASSYEAANLLHIGAPITYLETYSFWNTEQQQQEGIILVASRDKVLWYRGVEQSDEIKLYWEWVVGNPISGLAYFTVDNRDYLVVSSNQSSRTGYYALNIYQFELKHKEFWIAQRMQLEHPCEEVTFLNTGRDLILAIPQNNTAAIYSFNPHADGTSHVHFQLMHSFESENIHFINAFQMGGRSYLGLGGLQPQILLYQQGKFVPKTIFGSNFGLVEFFFPIPVRTYRDDLILLVQHRVDFGTHSLTVLETLIWDGEAFEATIPAPCKLGEHVFYGVSCMLDIQRDAGLKGAALLRRGDEISVIVPRHQAESGLFRLHTKLLAKNSELVDLQEIYKFLKDWVAEQDTLIAEARAFLAEPIETSRNNQAPDFNNLDLLKTPELFFNGIVDELYVNDYKWTPQDSSMNLESLINEIENFGNELNTYRYRRNIEEDIPSFDHLDFDYVEATELEVKHVNGVPFYINDGQLNFDGILNLVNLEVLEAAHLREARQALDAEMVVNGDLEFEKINGVPWRDIKENLVFCNKPLTLDNLEVDGDVIVEDRLFIEKLNELKFPDDFLWADENLNSVITGVKNFTGELACNEMDTLGYINDKDPINAVSLSNIQEWTGVPTFAQLEISEIMELNGTTHGRSFEDFPQNPTLEETKSIIANCEFTNLKVLGEIKVNGTVNNKPLSSLVADVVQRTEDAETEIRIPSKKIFNKVEFPIDFHIRNDAIGHLALDQFVTRHTKQDLNFTRLEGLVYFRNLTMTGAYDGVHIDELLREAIKIDEPQISLNTQVNFLGPMQAENVSILKTLNSVPITGYQTINDDLVTPIARFETLKVEEASIPGDINGEAGNINGLDLGALFEHHNSPTNKSIARNVFINELTLEEGLETDEIQSLNTEFLDQFLTEVDTLPEMIKNGKIRIDNIIVTGDVQVNKINGQNFDEDIQATAIWLNRPNYLNTTLQFTEPVDLQDDLAVLGDYNKQNLPKLIDDMVFRSANDTILIVAPKKFMKNVMVFENTQLDAINGIPFSEIANKQTDNVFRGSLRINGNLVVQELMLNDSLNNFPIKNLTDRVRYERELQAFVVLGVTEFPTPMELEDLTVYGDLNEWKNLPKFFNNLAYKNTNCVLDGVYNFTGRISIDNGAFINNLNGHDLVDLFSNIVVINDSEPIVVETPVKFEAPVNSVYLNVLGNLTTEKINACSIEEWLNNTLLVNRAETINKFMRFAPNSLHGNSFDVDYLNDIDLSQIVTLNTPQNLSSDVHFSEVYLEGTIQTNGSVNNVDLQMEYNNTVMIYGNQHIETPLTLQSITVLQNLQTNALVNGDKDLTLVASLHENSNFESPFFFQELNVENVLTADFVSGIFFDDWYKNTLWIQGRPQQHITGNWSIRSLSLKNGPSMPDYVLNNRRSTRDEKQYRELCEKLQKILTKYNGRGYLIKYIRKSFKLDLEAVTILAPIRRSFILENTQSNYLLINIGCKSSIFKWSTEHKIFEPLVTMDTGVIDQLVMLPVKTDTESIRFLTNLRASIPESCRFQGLNLWILESDKVEHLKSYDEKVKKLWSPEKVGAIIGITAAGFKEISLTAPYNLIHCNHTEAIDPENFDINGYALDSEFLFKNQTHLIQVSRSPQPTVKRNRRSAPTKYNFFTAYPRAVQPLKVHGESILKPNATLTHKLTFADFTQVIERILEDLDYRLGIEVNVTQLSIPESDLYDAHLITDFIAIMAELRSQNIYPPHTFDQIDLDTIDIPDNPAQVLAARTVQILWPVIVEINEVHEYLRGNSTKHHPISACILSQLGKMVLDVLSLANNKPQQQDNEAVDYAPVLTAVIERILKFQGELKGLENELKLEIDEDLKAETANEVLNSTAFIVNNTVEPLDFQGASDLPITNSLPRNITLNIHKTSEVLSLRKEELLSLEVGSVLEPRMLFAITTTTQSTPVPSQPAGIKLYMDPLQSTLFQFIPAHRARSLIAIRIRSLTLFAYVEHCCTVHVLHYRGIEGFVSFAKFNAESSILHLMSFRFPQTAEVAPTFYLTTVLERKLVFYEIVTAGLTEILVNNLEPCK